MVSSQKDIPAWLKKGVPKSADIEKILTPSREEMYRALQLYHAHVRYVITIMLSLITAMFAILGLSARLGDVIAEPEIISTVVGALLIAGCPVALIAVVIIWRYYLVYLSSLVFAVRVHLGSPFKITHPWFNRTIEQAIRWSKVRDDIGFIHKRASSPTDTFMLYVYIILCLAGLSLFCGLKIL